MINNSPVPFGRCAARNAVTTSASGEKINVCNEYSMDCISLKAVQATSQVDTRAMQLYPTTTKEGGYGGEEKGSYKAIFTITARTCDLTHVEAFDAPLNTGGSVSTCSK